MEKIKVQNHKNVRIMSIEMPAKALGILVLTKTGSRFENSKKAGISHFLEHILFDGTKKRPSPTLIAHEIDQIGAEFNGYTSAEYTGFYVKLIPRKYRTGLDVLSDMLNNSLYSNSDIKKEKKVIADEIRTTEDIPMRKADIEFQKILFPKSAVGKRSIGTLKSINSITKKDLIDYRKNYTYDDTIVIISGSGKYFELAKKETPKYFKFPKAKVEKSDILQDEQTEPQIKIIKRTTEQSHITIGFRTVGFIDEDYFVLKIISNVLGKGMSSRLFDIVRTKNALAYTVGADQVAFSDVGGFGASASVAHKNSQRVVDLIIKEIKKIKESGITAKELQKAKDSIEGNMAISYDDTIELAELFGIEYVLLGRYLTLNQLFKKYDAVTLKDCVRVANKYFDFNKLNIALVGKGKIKL